MAHWRQSWVLVKDLIPGVRGLSVSWAAHYLGDLGPNTLSPNLCIYKIGIRSSTLLLRVVRNTCEKCVYSSWHTAGQARNQW